MSESSASLSVDSTVQAWAGRREPSHVLHLDTAACGRTSRAVRARVSTHLDVEASDGGYVAEAAVATELAQARGMLGSMLGFDARDVAFVESGSAALAQLLASWPLEAGDEVWVAPSEWGPNLAAFDDRGLRVGLIEVDASGVTDLDALSARLAHHRPAMLHLTAMAAHRALAQPVTDVVEICATYGVPVVVDTAQAIGHVPVAGGLAPAAVYGTGRKYLCGPRGVGYLAVRDPWQTQLVPRSPALAAQRWGGDDRPVRRLEGREASVASRVGLGVALKEYLALGADQIMLALQELGDALRWALTDVPNWRLRDEPGAPGAIVSLVPVGDIDVRRARSALQAHGMLATAALLERAPNEMTGPLLRLSPHLDLARQDVGQVLQVLRKFTWNR